MLAFGKINSFFSALLHFAYPPFCLHCNAFLEREVKIFCKSCLESLFLVDLEGRCPCCFHLRASKNCSHSKLPWHFAAAAFEYEGAAATWVKTLKYGNQPYLAKGAAAFMAVQFFRLKWPIPDLIVPVPISPIRWMQRGYNQSERLAKELSKLLDRPFFKAVGRKNGDHSQASLLRQDRLKLLPETFYLRKKERLEEKNILLIDDVMTTQRTIKCCAEVLLEASPASIYVLTVCHALDSLEK